MWPGLDSTRPKRSARATLRRPQLGTVRRNPREVRVAAAAASSPSTTAGRTASAPPRYSTAEHRFSSPDCSPERSSLIRASWTATRHALAAIEQNIAGGRSGDRVTSQWRREYQARHHHQPERRSQVPRPPARQPAGALHTAGSGRAEETHPPARGCSKEIQPGL
ncbi:hypothetical protein VPH35_094594 [Triticum aestivum]